ncbi:MAG: hypothetical protein A2X29_05885 [Elusimicrobia bacterium GWA2_64_40]|nr:MAG: hypothetical protein A2X29_05885 [Elusimicrobia bacterium GWA2_64_40]HAN03836.1 hypothetical protein [Elusimicrobiota bacterium]
MNEEKESKLVSLLAARRSEAFWRRQKAGILRAAVEERGPRRAWLLAPAAALAALLVLVLARNPRQPVLDEPQAVSAAFIEHLDLLDDMDVLEAVPEEEL